jgi:hypothetical protein
VKSSRAPSDSPESMEGEAGILRRQQDRPNNGKPARGRRRTGGAAGENPTLARSRTETEPAAHLREQRKSRRKPEQKSRQSSGGGTEPSARAARLRAKVKTGRKERVPGGASSGRADRKAETLTNARQANVRRRRRGIQRAVLTDATGQGNESLAAAA